MPELDLFVPGILFPAIPLLMNNFGARYSSLSALIRKLHDQLLEISKDDKLHWKLYQLQIKTLRKRLTWNIRIQASIGGAFLFNVITMLALFFGAQILGVVSFAFVLALMTASVVFYLMEIQLAASALDTHLSDLEGAEPKA